MFEDFFHCSQQLISDIYFSQLYLYSLQNSIKSYYKNLDIFYFTLKVVVIEKQ